MNTDSATTIYDRDGIAVPELWQASIAKWESLPLTWRLRQSASEMERLDREAARATKPRRAASTRYTTQYAIDWGRAQGWRLRDRERFDARTRRHHDLMLGADAMFETPDGLVLVQGAGRYERNEHRRRFEECGGADAGARMRVRMVYVEFARGCRVPTLIEWWVL